MSQTGEPAVNNNSTYFYFMSNTNKRVAALCLGVATMLVPAVMQAQTAALQGALNQLFSVAEQHNATLQSMQSAIDVAQAGVDAAQKAKLPDVEAQLSVSYLGDAWLWNRHFGESTKAPMPHFGNNFLFKAQQVIYSGGALSAGVTMARQNEQMQRLTADGERLRIQFLLTGLYLQLHSLHNQQLVYERNRTLAEEQIALMKQRYSKGVALHSDITRYELQLQQISLGLTAVTDRQNIVRKQLTTALGIVDGDTATISSTVNMLPEEAFDDKTINIGAEAEWQQLATQGHVGLQQSSLGVDMSRTQEKLERSERLPKLAIVAENHLDGPITIEVPPIDKNLNYWFVGVGVSYNLSSLWKNKTKVRKARLATANAQDRLAETRREVSDGVHAAYVDFGTARTQLATREKSLQLASENYDVVSRRYQNGLAIVTDLTDAANMRLDAELQLANSRIGLVYAYYNLCYVVKK